LARECALPRAEGMVMGMARC